MEQYIAVGPNDPIGRTGAIKLHGPAAFEGMRRAGQVTADVLDALAHVVVPGVSTKTLDEFARARIEAAGAIAVNIGYKGYEHATCISINNVVCHGIPADRTLKAGDISTSI